MNQDQEKGQARRGFAIHERRCPSCMLVRFYCICSRVPKKSTNTLVSFVCHFLELKRPSNTARIGSLALEHADIHRFGTKDGFDWESLKDPNKQQILLFPAGPNIKQAPLDFPDKELQIIVPDGNWPQASRIAKKALRAGAAKPYSIDLPRKSRYRLRKDKTRTDGFATLESLAYCFEGLGQNDVANHLHRAFDLFVEGHLAYKKQSQVKGFPF